MALNACPLQTTYPLGIASSKTADELADPVQGIIVPIGTALADLILL